MAAARKGLTGRRVRVTLPGGVLDIVWRDDDHILMTGPVSTSGGRAAMSDDVDVVTLGCRLNAYEMRGRCARSPATPGLRDAVIVNTCAVTGEAVRQARQAIRRRGASGPSAAIIVTGCAAQIDPESFAAMPEVDRVIGNAEKMQAETLRDSGSDTRACASTTSWRARNRRRT